MEWGDEIGKEGGEAELMRKRRRVGRGRALRRTVEILLLLVGVALIVFPWWERSVQEQKQKQLLAQWEAMMEAEAFATRMESAPEPLIALAPSGQSETAPAERPEPAGPVEIDGERVLGTLSIEKIDLLEPVLARTTEKTLKLGIGSVVPEVLPGESGNLSLAGHRSRTYGKQFNRLDELEEGDRIALETMNGSYLYEVTSKFVVKPDGVHVLAQDESKRELTLITCEPMRNPTHRLIVKATLIQASDTDGTEKVNAV